MIDSKALVLNNCKVFNASIALQVPSTNSSNLITITNTLFDQNNRSIELNAMPTTFVCTGNTFQCSTGGIAALGGAFPDAGIYLANTNGLTIGSLTLTNALRNKFKRLRRGIYIAPSSENTTIASADFTDIQIYNVGAIAPNPATTTYGRAIIAEGLVNANLNKLTVERVGSIHPAANCIFSNCFVGIQGNNVEMRIKQNTISGGTQADKGIFCNAAQTKNIVVLNNTITGYTTGIDAYQNNDNTVGIDYNIITTDKANRIASAHYRPSQQLG
jgi:hypothetical protein